MTWKDDGQSTGRVRVDLCIHLFIYLFSDPQTKLALRAGNEKEEGETADTVGCCSLRVEHITLHEKLEGNECVVEFDFLGKDSIRYYNKVPVITKVTEQRHQKHFRTPLPCLRFDRKKSVLEIQIVDQSQRFICRGLRLPT